MASRQGETRGSLVAFDAKTGSEVWSVPDSVLLGAAGDTLVVSPSGTRPPFARALSLTSRSEVWRVPLGGTVAASLVSPDIVFVVTNSADGAMVTAVDTLTGQELWRRSLGWSIKSSPVMVNDDLYLTAVES